MITLCIIIGIILLLAMLYFTVFIRPRGKAPQNPRILRNYAHRGLHGGGVPENSLDAFELACKKGYGIELDVQLSRDGEVMVFHDYTLIRMTGEKGKLCEYDAKALKELKLSDSTQYIPTFKEVLALVNGRVPILIELKGESLDTSLCSPVADILKGYTGDYCIESFNPFLLAKMRTLLKDAYYGQLYTNVCRDKKNYNPLNILLTGMTFNFIARPDFIAYNKKDRHSAVVKLTTRLYRAKKFVWTIKDGDKTNADEHAIFEK